MAENGNTTGELGKLLAEKVGSAKATLVQQRARFVLGQGSNGSGLDQLDDVNASNLDGLASQFEDSIKNRSVDQLLEDPSAIDKPLFELSEQTRQQGFDQLLGDHRSLRDADGALGRDRTTNLVDDGRSQLGVDGTKQVLGRLDEKSTSEQLVRGLGRLPDQPAPGGDLPQIMDELRERAADETECPPPRPWEATGAPIYGIVGAAVGEEKANGLVKRSRQRIDATTYVEGIATTIQHAGQVDSARISALAQQHLSRPSVDELDSDPTPYDKVRDGVLDEIDYGCGEPKGCKPGCLGSLSLRDAGCLPWGAGGAAAIIIAIIIGVFAFSGDDGDNQPADDAQNPAAQAEDPGSSITTETITIETGAGPVEAEVTRNPDATTTAVISQSLNAVPADNQPLVDALTQACATTVVFDTTPNQAVLTEIYTDVIQMPGEYDLPEDVVTLGASASAQAAVAAVGDAIAAGLLGLGKAVAMSPADPPPDMEGVDVHVLVSSGDTDFVPTAEQWGAAGATVDSIDGALHGTDIFAGPDGEDVVDRVVNHLC